MKNVLFSLSAVYIFLSSCQPAKIKVPPSSQNKSSAKCSGNLALADTSGSASGSSGVDLNSLWASIGSELLTPYCISCHNAQSAAGTTGASVALPDFTDQYTFEAYISEIIARLQAGTMPPSTATPVPPAVMTQSIGDLNNYQNILDTYYNEDSSSGYDGYTGYSYNPCQ